MKTSLPHLASNSSLNNHAHEKNSVRSFSKIIFPKIPRYDERYPDRMARKVAKDKAKLFRFRKDAVTKERPSVLFQITTEPKISKIKSDYIYEAREILSESDSMQSTIGISMDAQAFLSHRKR